jgi:hypothetical protein
VRAPGAKLGSWRRMIGMMSRGLNFISGLASNRSFHRASEVKS